MTIVRFPLYALAHSRTGDKGDKSNISVIAWHPDLLETLVSQVTAETVAEHFKSRNVSSVRRFLLPKLHSMNLVLDGVLDGGVNSALNLDAHGKALSFHLLNMQVEVSSALLPFLKIPSKA